MGGDLIKYPGLLTTRMMNEEVRTKFLWNLISHRNNTKFLANNVINCFLNNSLDQYKNMLMLVNIIPEHFIQQHNFRAKETNDINTCKFENESMAYLKL